MGQRVFDPSTDTLALARLPIRDDHLRVAQIATIGHHMRTRALPVHARVPVGLAVVAVTRHRVPDRDPSAGVGVDDDLHVHRISIVLAGRGHTAVVGVGTSVPSTTSTVSGS